MKIKLNMLDDIRSFTNSCTSSEGDISVKQGRYTVNGKSILGIFSLDLSQEIIVSYEGENDVAEAEFYQYISKWKVEE